MTPRQPKMLFLIDNVPLALDSRVQREAGTLRSEGFAISVICPSGPGEGWHELVDEMHVYRYPKPAMGPGVAAHVVEYLVAVIAHTVLCLVVALRHGFDIVHIANPPDVLSLVAAPYKLIGKRLVFDHHDLVPELFEVRYAARFRGRSSLVRAAERASFRLADHVISTNESFRRTAIERGRVSPHRVTVVRNGPRLGVDFPPVTPDPATRSQAK